MLWRRLQATVYNVMFVIVTGACYGDVSRLLFILLCLLLLQLRVIETSTSLPAMPGTASHLIKVTKPFFTNIS